PQGAARNTEFSPVHLSSVVNALYGNGRLPRWIKERRLHDSRPYLKPDAFYRDLHLHLGTGAGVLGLNTSERDHLLQQRRPGGRSRLADLLAARINGHMHTRRLARRLRGETKLVVQPFDLVPIHFQPNQLPRYAVLAVRQQRRAADEVLLLEMDHLPEAQFVRRIFL